jgi:putative flippase GtrA
MSHVVSPVAPKLLSSVAGSAMANNTDNLSSPGTDASSGRVRALLNSDSARKGLRYAAVSGVAIAVSMAAFAVSYRLVHLTAGWSQTVAVVLSTIPSYYLNRAWVWGKNGKSHFMKEVVPFWGISLIQFVISVLVVNFAEGHVVDVFDGKSAQTLALTIVNLLTYGVMWIAKFVLFNKVLFAHKHPELVAD